MNGIRRRILLVVVGIIKNSFKRNNVPNSTVPIIVWSSCSAQREEWSRWAPWWKHNEYTSQGRIQRYFFSRVQVLVRSCLSHPGNVTSPIVACCHFGAEYEMTVSPRSKDRREIVKVGFIILEKTRSVYQGLHVADVYGLCYRSYHEIDAFISFISF